MEHAEALEKFRRANILYRAGDYKHALALLDALDAAIPGTEHLVYSRARCLAHLGQTFDAVELCDKLIKYRNSANARKLRDKIWRQPSALPTSSNPSSVSDSLIPTEGAFDFAATDLGAQIAPPPASRPVQVDNWFVSFCKDWGKQVLIVAVIVALVAGGLLAAWYAVHHSGAKAPTATAAGPEEDLFVNVVRIVFVLDVVATFLAVFLTLLFFDHWPRPTLTGNIAYVLGGVVGTLALTWLVRHFTDTAFIARIVWVGALSGIFRLNFAGIFTVWLIRTLIFVGAILLGFLTWSTVV